MKKKVLAILGIGNALLHNRLRLAEASSKFQQVLEGDHETVQAELRRQQLIQSKDWWGYKFPLRAMVYRLAKGSKYLIGTLPPREGWEHGSRQVRRRALFALCFTRISRAPLNSRTSRRRRRSAARKLAWMQFREGQAAWKD